MWLLERKLRKTANRSRRNRTLKKIAVTILNQKLSADLLNPKVVKKYQTEIDKVTEKANDTE